MEAKNPAPPVQTKAVVLANDRGLQFSNLDEMWRFCVAIVASNQFKGIESPEVALVRLQAGLELGLSPIWSLTNIMVVDGRPSVWGDALLGLVLNHPACEDVIENCEGEGDELTAYCEVIRRGRQPIKRSFSWAEAKEAGLANKDTWKKYKKRMLQMRARSWACRDGFADALRGLGVVEELRDVEPRRIEAREIERKPKEAIVLPGDEPTPEAYTQCDYLHEDPPCKDPKCWITRTVDAKKTEENKEGQGTE